MSAEDPNDPTAEPTPATDLSHEPDSSDPPTTAAGPDEAAHAADLSEEPVAAAADSSDPDAPALSEEPGASEDAEANSSADDAAETDTAEPPSDAGATRDGAVAPEPGAPSVADAVDASDLDVEPVGSDEAPSDTPEAPPDADTPVDETDADTAPTGSEAATDVEDPPHGSDGSEAAAPTDTELTGSEPLADATTSAEDPDAPAPSIAEPSDSDVPEDAFASAEPSDSDDAAGVLDPEDPLVAMLAELDAPRRPAPAGVQLSEELPIDPEDDLRGVEGEASLRLVSILESLLFAAARPLKVQDLRRILAETSKHQIQLALAHLMAITRDRGVVLAQVAGGFQFRTHPENAVWVQKMLQSKPARLSRTQIETLAIVAYRQPITRPEIDDVRGVDSGAVLKGLLERELVQIVGRKEEPGRPLLYGTTVKFLEFFNLRGLRDLPTLRDFRDLSEESKATLRTQLGASEAEALGQGVLGFPSAAPEEIDDMQQPTIDEMPSGPDHAGGTGSPESDFTTGGSSETLGEVDPPEQEPTPVELPGDPSPDELVPPAPERLPQPGPDEIRPPDPGTDSPDSPDEWHAPGPDIADVPGVDPGPDEPSEV